MAPAAVERLLAVSGRSTYLAYQRARPKARTGTGKNSYHGPSVDRPVPCPVCKTVLGGSSDSARPNGRRSCPIGYQARAHHRPTSLSHSDRNLLLYDPALWVHARGVTSGQRHGTPGPPGPPGPPASQCHLVSCCASFTTTTARERCLHDVFFGTGW